MIPLEVRNFQILQLPPTNYLGGLGVIVFGEVWWTRGWGKLGFRDTPALGLLASLVWVS